MDTSHPLGPAPTAAPVAVTPGRMTRSATLITNVVVVLVAWLSVPELADLLRQIGGDHAAQLLAAALSALGGVNMLIRIFKTRAPLAGTPAERKARTGF